MKRSSGCPSVNAACSNLSELVISPKSWCADEMAQQSIIATTLVIRSIKEHSNIVMAQVVSSDVMYCHASEFFNESSWLLNISLRSFAYNENFDNRFYISFWRISYKRNSLTRSLLTKRLSWVGKKPGSIRLSRIGAGGSDVWNSTRPERLTNEKKTSETIYSPLCFAQPYINRK